MNWQESDIPGLADKPVRPNLRKRRLQDVVDTAYHEAGHAVAWEAFGFGLSSIWITGEVAAQKRSAGRTQAEVEDVLTLELSDGQRFVIARAGDTAIEIRNGTRFGPAWSGEGVAEAAEAG
jgi:hypothetical protein